MMNWYPQPDSEPAQSWYCLSSTAETGAVDWAELVPAKSHGVLLIGLSALVQLGLTGNGIVCFSSRKPLRSHFSQG
jgi:hypothetical protein